MNRLQKTLLIVPVAAILAAAALAQAPVAPARTAAASAQPAWLNPNLPARQRAAALVNQLTLREKVSQLTNESRAIPRLHIPAYEWWSESLHGVAVNGTTEFPEPIGLAATWDVPLIHQMGRAISLEGRVEHEQYIAQHHGNSGIFHGLDFWAPNINIFRDPRWGRGQETYGEDPFLTSRFAVAFVTGMQGSNPHFYRVISTPKHFDAHSGPEPIRHFSDYDISRHTLEDTYLPAFRAAVVKGHAGSVMCAYTALNGQPDCASHFLLQTQLRTDWQFKGYVVSDCDAVHDIFTGHHYRPTQAQASAISLERGMDNECAGYFTSTPKNENDYAPFLKAVQEGYLPVSAINRDLVRLFTARIKLGMFDPPGVDPYNHIPASELNSPAHRALARKIAEESMVLLKNNGVLPLKPSIRSIAVVGPLASQTQVLLGNYSGTPTHTVSFMEGLKADFPHAQITYVPGTQFLSNQGGHPVPASLLTTPAGRPGIEAQYSIGFAFFGGHAKPLVSRVEPAINLSASNLPAAARHAPRLFVHWTGYLTPTHSGDYYLGIRSNGFARVSLAGHGVAQAFGNGPHMGWIHLTRGQRMKLDVVYGFGFQSHAAPRAQLIWAPISNHPDPAAIAAARRADVVIAVVGITSHLESEQAPIDQPGFFGGDRTRLRLPAPEEALVRAVGKVGKPLVVVLYNGSCLAVPWEKKHAAAILDAWYSGEEGGAAIADTLIGKNDPAGRLPMTFYKSVHQLPPFEDYSMRNRTYRYFHGHPLWPFGYGLSYTTFAFSHLTLPSAPIAAGQPLHVSVTVTNTGRVAGDEVAELYLKFPPVPGAPAIALRGLRRIHHLAPGASRKVNFVLHRRALSLVTNLGHIIVAPGKYFISVGGGQPATGTPAVTGHFQIHGQIILPD